MDRMRNKSTRKLVSVRKEIDKVINEIMGKWYGHIKRVDANRMGNRVLKSEPNWYEEVG